MALALVAGVLLLAPAVAGAATLVVSPWNMQGCTPQHVGTGSQAFVSGPATPPLGNGSYQLSLGADGENSYEAMRLPIAAGTHLQDLTRLSYSTYVAGYLTPYLIIALDLNDDGAFGAGDEQLIWEAYYQPAQVGAILPFTWQSWDNAIDSRWWSPYVAQDAWSGQFTPVTLADYLANRTHTGDITVLGGIRVMIGGGWAPDFVGHFDAFTIGVSGVDTTYDLELWPAIWNGFFQPVDNPEIWNKAKAGQAIPVKFSLGGYRGLDIFKAGYPQLVPKALPSAKTYLDTIETYAAAGSGSLTYDSASDQYNYVLKTTKGLANTGWTFDLGLKDGSDHTFWIEFVK